jgi:hypothetical protein
MKQFLLIFDSITFIDPVDDDGWRETLFRGIEREHPGYRSYRDVAQAMPWLRQQKIVRVVNPSTLNSKNSDLTTAASFSDLGDASWTKATDPRRWQLPTQFKRTTGQPIWNVFLDKMPCKFVEALTNDPLIAQHLIYEGGDSYAWELSYAAGSSIGINVHLAAAEELGLAPVTDSRLHHELILMKLAREADIATPGFPTELYTDYVSRQSVFGIMGEILPRRDLEKLSLDDIINFRDVTKPAREHFLNEIRSTVLADADFGKPNAHFLIESKVASSLLKQTKAYGDELAAVRD